ncbi:hypothetical protein MB46_10275 [Arthrobacter alpinus]|uniref:helix-turn-helix domain-containing protein n=1 Tax=Arthrobacter alpinus TaxID=656366 RepID=UPI0006784416|nr:helix-turn-helix domain-containing protein [Arthrobacter alpinus]ALV45806.1 hypothetical protein MB46_10275 [Arthrobacter alpinus]
MSVMALPRFLTPADVAEALQIPVGTLANWRSAGKGPRFSRFGGLVRYDPDDVAAWLAEQRVS